LKPPRSRAEDLADLRDYIGNDNPSAAQRVAALIFQTIERNLSENSELGHPGPHQWNAQARDPPTLIPAVASGTHHNSRQSKRSNATFHDNCISNNE
jgi:plasmid stabilization system protein ParE